MSLAVHEVTYAYPKGPPVLQGVTVEFTDSVTAVIGPNGAGKSTLLRLLGDLQHPRSSQGRIAMEGKDLGSLSASERVRRIAYVSQTPLVSAPLTVREVVGLSRVLIEADQAAVDRAIAEVGLESRQDDLFSSMSVGQRQLAAIARALAQLGFDRDDSPRYLLADEPIAALDPHHAIEIARQLRSATDRGIRCVLVVHDLTFARAVSDRIIGLGRDGRIAADGSPEDTLTEEKLGQLFGCRFERTENELRPSYGG